MPKLIAFIRPSDWEVFSLNEDGETFSNESIKNHYPGHLVNKFSDARLRITGFHEVFESVNQFIRPEPRNCGE